VKALYEIRYPQLSQLDRTLDERRFDASNQERLNDNFRKISEELYQHGLSIDEVPDLIAAAIPNHADYLTDVSDVGIWTCRKWNSGRAECFGKTASLALTTSNASGNLFYAETTVTLPTDFFTSVLAVEVCPIGALLALASVKTVSTSQIVAYVANTANALINVVLSLYVAGRWKEE
jgi:hypothetical protein